jgi:hypothetical protein
MSEPENVKTPQHAEPVEPSGNVELVPDDDVPQLSGETFQALAQFYQEQDQREQELQAAQLVAAQGSGVAQVIIFNQKLFFFVSEFDFNFLKLFSAHIPSYNTTLIEKCDK